jgi:hypothetical protein
VRMIIRYNVGYTRSPDRFTMYSLCSEISVPDAYTYSFD